MEQVVFNCPECITEISVEKKFIGTEMICDECSSRISVPAPYAEPTEPKVAKKDPRDAIPVVLTTAPSLDGYKVLKTIEIVTSECAFGMNIFRDFFASMRDFFGGHSKATQKVLRDSRKHCLRELKYEAMLVGANAVIAVSLDYSEISGQGKSMLFLVASGTAVKVEKIIDDVPLELAEPL